jgi:ornithine carbamoyltransferase
VKNQHQLSPAQIDFLLHRLQIPEAMTEAMTECYLAGMDCGRANPPLLNPDVSIADAITAVEQRVRAGRVYVKNWLEAEVLAEAVEGSTWFAMVKREASFKNNEGLIVGRAIRTVTATTKKVSEIVDRELEPVLW